MYQNEEELKNVFEEALKEFLYGESFREEVAKGMYKAYEKYRKESIKEISEHLSNGVNSSISAINFGRIRD